MTHDDATGWFEQLYVAAESGDAVVPWDRAAPNHVLVEWASARGLAGAGQRAVVVGSGLGMDSEYVAGLGFATTAFDIAPSAIAEVRRRFPDSQVDYVVADLLDPPASWDEAFDLVVESITVQSLPRSLRAEAIAGVRAMVAPGGTLIVIAAALGESDDPDSGPPWPLTRADVESFAEGGVEMVLLEELNDSDSPTVLRWRAELRRQAG